MDQLMWVWEMAAAVSILVSLSSLPTANTASAMMLHRRVKRHSQAVMVNRPSGSAANQSCRRRRGNIRVIVSSRSRRRRGKALVASLRSDPVARSRRAMRVSMSVSRPAGEKVHCTAPDRFAACRGAGIGCGREQARRNGMPEVVVYALGGRSVDQKRALVKDITNAVVKNYSVEPGAVVVTIVESAKEDKAKGGVLFSEMAP